MLKSRLPMIAAELPGAVEAALVAAADLVVSSAKSRVPVDTGRLRDAIHAEVEPEGVFVRGGDKQAWYGGLVEHGTVFQPPRPFLVPALEENRAVVETEIIAAIRAVT